MNYCNQCGERVSWRRPDGDDRERYVCDNCHTVHYQNPRVVVGAIPQKNGNILMCRRAIEPCIGKWTLPAGYLENNETTAECALRESREEAEAALKNLHPYALLNLPFIDQVYFMYRADLGSEHFAPGVESQEVKLFKPEDIPWSEIAFTVISEVLLLYLQDRTMNHFPFRVVDVAPP